MNEILRRYGIDPSLSADGKLTLLEKEKQKLLRKLNHVFGDPQKEKEVGDELDELEEVMLRLEQSGGKQLSMEDVRLEVRSLSQTQLTFSEEEEEMDAEEEAQIAELNEIRKLQRAVMDNNGEDWDVCIPGIGTIVDFYEERGSQFNMETWLVRGAQWVPHKIFLFRLYQLYCDWEEAPIDQNTRLYWTRRAADLGEKSACYKMGEYHTKKPQFDLQKAGRYFAKAAGDEYPEAYLQAFKVYYNLKDYRRAEICLQAAMKKNIPGAAYYMGAMYEMDENPEGRENPDKARAWFEKAYRENPDGLVCHALGSRYIEEDRYEEGLRLLKEGAEIYQDEDCAELYQELTS